MAAALYCIEGRNGRRWLIDTAIRQRRNLAEYTVSELALALKRTVEDAFGYVRLRGEISGFRGPHSSGHGYFTLKDDGAASRP